MRPVGGGLKGCLGAVLGVIVVVVLILVVIGAAVKKAEKLHAASGITPRQFNRATFGMSEGAVESELGKPERAQLFESRGIFTKAPLNSTCIYYHEHGQQPFRGHSYRLCFFNGKLLAKADY